MSSNALPTSVCRLAAEHRANSTSTSNPRLKNGQKSSRTPTFERSTKHNALMKFECYKICNGPHDYVGNYQTRSAKEIWLDNRRRVKVSSRQTGLAGD